MCDWGCRTGVNFSYVQSFSGPGDKALSISFSVPWHILHGTPIVTNHRSTSTLVSRKYCTGQFDGFCRAVFKKKPAKNGIPEEMATLLHWSYGALDYRYGYLVAPSHQVLHECPNIVVAKFTTLMFRDIKEEFSGEHGDDVP